MPRYAANIFTRILPACSIVLLLLVAGGHAFAQQTDGAASPPANTSAGSQITENTTTVDFRTAPLLGLGRRAKPGEVPPKAMLIEILTRQNQRNYLVANRPDLLPVFEHDVSEVARRTVMDWSTYFKFCPLYFFVDTNADKIRLGQFEGVLLDSTMQPASNLAVQTGERNIYIGYFGSPLPQPDTTGPPGPLGQYMEHDGDDVTSLIRERFLVHDADFRMLPDAKPRTNFVRAIRPPEMSGREYRHYRRSITYNASRWYIDYQPTAYSYDATLRRYFRINK